MTRPGERLRTLARRLCEPRTMDRLIDPAIADIQQEYSEAIVHGRLWRARWVRLAGSWGLLKGACLYALTEWTVGRTALIASTATALATVPLVLVPLMHAAPFIRANGIHGSALLVMYLLPQALAIGIPVGFAFGVLSASRSAVMARRSRRLILALALGCSVATFLNMAWISPAANQQFRMLVAGRWVKRGANELTFNELRQRTTESAATVDDVRDPLPALFWYHARLAACAAPILMAGFAVAVAALRRRRFRWMYAGLALSLYLSCYILFPPEQVASLLHWLPPVVVAWLPNLLLIGAAATSAASGGVRVSTSGID
jgi:Lipopolysaccharide export system permease LptF/LptG